MALCLHRSEMHILGSECQGFPGSFFLMLDTSSLFYIVSSICLRKKSLLSCCFSLYTLPENVSYYFSLSSFVTY